MSQFSASIQFKFSSNFDKVAKGISKSVKGLTKDFSKLTKSVSANEQGFESLNRTLRRGFLVGLAFLTASFAIATVKAQEYDKALAQLSAITGLAGKDLDRFGKQSLQASNRFGVSAANYLEAVQLVASAKPELLEQPQLLKQISDEAAILSKAAGIDLRSATLALTDSMNQFELGAMDANRAINVLAAGSKFGASLVGDTAQALVKAGVAAKLAGLNFEQTNAAIQVLAQRGIRGSMAGTQLKGTFLTLNQLMKQNNIPTVSKALELLSVAMANGADLTQQFGRENITAATILIESRKKMADMTEAITGTSIASEQARINMATFAERMARLKQVTFNALMVAFEPFIVALGWFADKLAVGLTFLGKYPRIMTGLIVVAGLLTAALGALSAGISIALAVSTGAAAAFAAAAASVWAFTVALLANPVTLIVIGVIALIAALGVLIAKWDNLRAALVAVGKVGIAFLRGMWEGLKQDVIPAWEEFTSIIGEAAEPFRELFNVFDEVFGELAEALGLTKDEMLGIANAGKIVGNVLAFVVKASLMPLRSLLIMFLAIKDVVQAFGFLITGQTDEALKSIKKLADRGLQLIQPLIDGFEKDAASESAGASAASTVAAAALGKQQLDVNLKVDTEGRVKVESIKSDKAINTAIESGMMIPEGV